MQELRPPDLLHQNQHFSKTGPHPQGDYVLVNSFKKHSSRPVAFTQAAHWNRLESFQSVTDRVLPLISEVVWAQGESTAPQVIECEASCEGHCPEKGP